MDLLRDIQQKLGTATILVSHDLGVVARAAERVAVMYAGKICEIGTAEEIYYQPEHPYTKGLLRSLPALSHGKEMLSTLPGMPPSLIHPPKGDAFACRNTQALAIDYEEQPPMFRISETHYAATWLLDPRAAKAREKMEQLEKAGHIEEAVQKKWVSHKTGDTQLQKAGENKPEILLDVQHLTQVFPLTRKLAVKAVDDVSFQIRRGEIFGLVGESGSGKSTVARCAMNIYRPQSGKILYRGTGYRRSGGRAQEPEAAADDEADHFPGFGFQFESADEGGRYCDRADEASAQKAGARQLSGRGGVSAAVCRTGCGVPG